MKRLESLLLFALMTTPTTHFAAGKDTRVFELRTYYAAPGKLDDLHARFRDHTVKIFERHGMVNVGYWVPQENPENKLIYLLAHQSREAAAKSWADFGKDPEWQVARKASEKDGRLVGKVEVVFLTATDYSPEIKPSAAAESRTFELRTYKTPPGRLEALHARFRDHTLKLFSRHGMTHFGYWTPMDKKDGADDTLIYILAHRSKEAADASFKAFREDAEWGAVRKASEDKAGGSLTLPQPDGVKSVFMKPADYSPAK